MPFYDSINCFSSRFISSLRPDSSGKCKPQSHESRYIRWIIMSGNSIRFNNKKRSLRYLLREKKSNSTKLLKWMLITLLITYISIEFMRFYTKMHKMYAI